METYTLVVRQLEEGRLLDNILGKTAPHIQVLMSEASAPFIKHVLGVIPAPKFGEHCPTHFRSRVIHFEGDPKRVFLKGHFVKNSKGDEISPEATAREFFGFYDLINHTGELQEMAIKLK